MSLTIRRLAPNDDRDRSSISTRSSTGFTIALRVKISFATMLA